MAHLEGEVDYVDNMPLSGNVDYGNVETFQHKMTQQQVGMGSGNCHRRFQGKHWCYIFQGIEQDWGPQIVVV